MPAFGATDTIDIVHSDVDHEKPTVTVYLTVLASWAGSFCMGTALGYSSPAGITLLRAADEGRSDISAEKIFWYVHPCVTLNLVHS